MELLLLSNSTNYGGTMFSHAAEAFSGVSSGSVVTFVPYALADWDDYADRAIAALASFGIEAVSAHRSGAPDRAILEAEVVMMGGGNTFRLLDSLYRLGVIEELGAAIILYELELGIPATEALTRPTDRLVDMVLAAFPALETRLATGAA